MEDSSIELGFCKNMELFLKLGFWTYSCSFLKINYIFEFPTLWGRFSTKNFQISIKFSGTRFLTILPFFSKFPDFSVVSFVLNLWFHYWIACDDLEARRKGKVSVVGWLGIFEASWFSKPCWVYLNLIFPLFRGLCVYAWVQMIWEWLHDSKGV